MKTIKQLFRLFYIQYVLARYGFDDILFSAPGFKTWRFLSYLNPWNWRKRKRSRGERIRLVFERLGPIFVKFGQLLSTRRDILPDDIIAELVKLQDQVPAFDGKLARNMIEASLEQELDAVFGDFDDQPIASASIAQVHAAKLKNGADVVVKVLRPKIHQIIRRDISLLGLVAKIAETVFPSSRRLKPTGIVQEFENNLLDEIDLMKEASNASQLRRNFLGSNILYVPDIHWQYTSSDIMVMERIHGIRISDIASLKSSGINMKKLAERLVDIFFTQVFRDSFFHADMHPGNLFVKATNPQNPQIIAIDFGIMGSLSPFDQNYLAQNFMAFFNRDYRKVSILHVESRWVPEGTRIEAFESAIRGVCEPIFARPLKDISFGQLLLRLFQTASRFRMEIMPQLLLLQKTLIHIEGLGRMIYPELDLWAAAKPTLEKWMQEKYSLKTFLKNARESIPKLNEQLFESSQSYQPESHKSSRANNLGKSSTRLWLAVASLLLAYGLFNLFWELEYQPIPVILSLIMAGAGLSLLIWKK